MANIGKRRNVYNTNIDTANVDYTMDVFDYVPDSPNVGIDFPSEEFYQIHVLSTRDPPPPRPGNPSKPPSRPHSQQLGPQKLFKRYLSTIPNFQIIESRCNESFEGLQH